MEIYVDYLSAGVENNPDYILLNRRDRDRILNEVGLSGSGCSDDDCAFLIGENLFLNEMIIGSLGRIGSFYILNVKLIDFDTGGSFSTFSERYSNIDELVIGSENVIATLFGESTDITESGPN